jgi:hypothetical protein
LHGEEEGAVLLARHEVLPDRLNEHASVGRTSIKRSAAFKPHQELARDKSESLRMSPKLD